MARHSWRPAITTSAPTKVKALGQRASTAKAAAMTPQVEAMAQAPRQSERAVSWAIWSRVNSSLILRRVTAGSSVGVALRRLSTVWAVEAVWVLMEAPRGEACAGDQ